MAMGFAVQLKNGQDVLMRIYPDVHLKGGNINLERAKQLTVRFADIVEQARLYILTDCGGSFERFAEWGLIRPKATTCYASTCKEIEMPYTEAIEQARLYVFTQFGSFEKFAEYGLIA